MTFHSLERLTSRPYDYKICSTCGMVNWCENSKCVSCGEDTFDRNGVGVEDWADEEYDYWAMSEGKKKVDTDMSELSVYC